MRKLWFQWVAKTRKKMQRGTKEPVTHRKAMKSAALTWPTEKLKILNKRKREERKRLKEKPKKEIKQSETVPSKSLTVQNV